MLIVRCKSIDLPIHIPLVYVIRMIDDTCNLFSLIYLVKSMKVLGLKTKKMESLTYFEATEDTHEQTSKSERSKT